MALVYHDAEVARTNQKIYMDRKYFSSYEDQVAQLRDSKWIYLGNLSFYTSESQLYALCSRVGPVNRGLNSKTKDPCGFAFVEFIRAEHALESIVMLNGSIVDNRQIRIELDFGFRNGRHLGRGQSGNQVRDDRRDAFDPGRSWGDSSFSYHSQSKSVSKLGTIEGKNVEDEKRGRADSNDDEEEDNKRRRRSSHGDNSGDESE